MLSAQRAVQWREAIAANITPMLPNRIGRLLACEGAVFEADGFAYPIGTQASIGTAPNLCRAEIVGFRGKRALLSLLSGSSNSLAPGDSVLAINGISAVAVGDAVLGRVLDALGDPIDNGAPLKTAHYWPLAGKPVPILQRGRVIEPFDSGVRAINALLTLGRGQRVALIAGSGVGKSVLMAQILAGAQVDRIVIGLIGERGREIADFLETKLGAAARAKSVVIAAPADEPPAVRLRAAQTATAIAESYRAQGLHVLLMIDSLTRIAHAQREIGLGLGEPPTVKGYPPSVFALIPNLVERAGVDQRNGGAITAIYTVLADGDDVQDPVVDSARAIMDGHIILSRSLAQAQVYPAIDVGQSISRVMPDVVDKPHLGAAAQYRQLWATYAENRDLVLMGAHKAGADPWLDAAIAARPAMLDFLRQPMQDQVGLPVSVAQLCNDYGPIERDAA
jgi:flagellum-specific ATP synthase